MLLSSGPFQPLPPQCGGKSPLPFPNSPAQKKISWGLVGVQISRTRFADAGVPIKPP